MILKNNVKSKHDTCVVCGEETEYAELDPILAQNFYVVGTGQLCQVCFDADWDGQKEKR